MAIVDVRNVPTIVEVGPSSIVADFTEEQVTAQVMVGPTVVEFSWGELVPEPGLSGGGVFQGTVYIRPDIPTLPALPQNQINAEQDLIMLWHAADDTHYKVFADIGGDEIVWATQEEVDEGVVHYKAIAPLTGAYAYDRLRHVGQHAAGKGTATVQLFPDALGNIQVDGALSNVFEVVVDRDIHFNDPINPVNGQTINIRLKQNLTGGWAATFGSAWEFVNKIDPTLSSAPGAKDLLSCQWNETDQLMQCSFLPNYGSGYIPPPVIDDTDLAFINVGGGEEILIGRTGLEVSYRTLTVAGDLSINTVGNVVQISYTTPPNTSVRNLNELDDVTAVDPAIGDSIVWNGSEWVKASARRWTVGATWTNGPNALIYPVNAVNAVVSEKSAIIGWYLLTDGASGSCQVDILRVPVHEFPPLISDSICASNLPSISSAYMASDTDLTGWLVDCLEGDLLQFKLNSVSGFTTVQLILVLEKRP